MFSEELPRLGDRLADRVGVDSQQLGQNVLGANLAQVDHGDQNPVRGREQAAAARARGPASCTSTLFEAALSGLRLLGRGEVGGQRGELATAHPGQPFITEQFQSRDPITGAFLRADREDQTAAGGDGVFHSPCWGCAWIGSPCNCSRVTAMPSG